jgi:DNA-binding NarL/FixJ family response regulator
MRTRPIRVVIVDNYRIVSESLDAVLRQELDIEVVATAGSVAEAAALAADLEPDVVTMDFHLSDGTGYDAARVMRELYPMVRFVFLSRDLSDDARLAALEAGASAYLHKSATGSEVLDAVRRVATGEMLITPLMVAELISQGRERMAVRESLSPRELEVLQLMAAGVHMREIAERLGISYTTVRTHVRSISAKLGATSMLQSVVIARELDLVI